MTREFIYTVINVMKQEALAAWFGKCVAAVYYTRSRKVDLRKRDQDACEY